MRRRVLNVIETLGRGGAEQLLVTTHRHLNRCRFEPAVATVFGPNPLADDLRGMDVPVHELGLSVPTDLPWGILRLRRLIQRERFEVVHTHLYYANIMGRLAAWGQARVVTTLHNPDYTYESSPTLFYRGKKLLDQVTGKHINQALLAVSDEVRRDFERQLGFTGIEVFRNYADVEAFRSRLDGLDRQRVRRELGLSDRDVALLHVGRLHRQKGQDLLLEALALTRRVHSRLVLFLVGEGGLRRVLQEKVRDSDLEEVVRFMGVVEDVAPYYKATDIFVFPSRYEAFGIALLEAMIAGLPAVVSGTGGILELVTEETALRVPVGDVAGLAKAIVSLSLDPGRRSAIGAAGRERAKAFDVRLHIHHLENVYASI